MSMEPKTVAYAQVSVTGGAITSSRRYNCTVTRTGAGIFEVVIGEGGVDRFLCSSCIAPQVSAAGGAGTARSPSLAHTTDTTKVILFTNDAAAAADPAGFWFEIKRYPPLPTP